MVCSLLGFSCTVDFIEVNQGMTRVGIKAWLSVKISTVVILSCENVDLLDVSAFRNSA